LAQAKKKEFRFRQEITALVCLFLGIFFLLCLLSYTLPLLADPPALQVPGANWCGGFGHYVARYLFSFLGITSFFPILVFFYLAAAVFLPHTNINRLPSIIAGITGILLAASGLLATSQQLIFPPEFITPGGYLGNLVRGLLEGVVGTVGSVLLLVLLLIFSLMAAVRFSPFTFSGWLWSQIGLLLKQALAKKPKLKSRAATKSRRATEPAVTLPESNPGLLQNPEPAQGVPAVHEPVRRELSMEPDESVFSLKPLKSGNYQLPPVSLLERNTQSDVEVDRKHYYKVSEILVAKLQDFGVKGTVEVVSPGPVVTTYEFAPAAGVKINKIVSLADDLAMVLKVDRVRIVGSIPGKAAIGIEIPNPVRRTVFLRDILMGNAYLSSAGRWWRILPACRTCLLPEPQGPVNRLPLMRLSPQFCSRQRRMRSVCC